MKFFIILISLALLNIGRTDSLRESTFASFVEGSDSKDHIKHIPSEFSYRLTSGSAGFPSGSQESGGITIIGLPINGNTNNTAANSTTTNNANSTGTATNADSANNNNTASSDNGGYVPLNITTAQNDTNFTNATAYALIYILAQGIQSTTLEEESYSLVQYLNASQLNTSDGGVNYQVQLQLNNTNNDTVNISLTTYFQNSTQSRQMVSFAYQYLSYTRHKVLKNISVAWANNTSLYTLNITTLDDPNDPYFDEDNWNYQPQISNLSTEDFLALGGYSPVGKRRLQYDQELADLLVYGANAAFQSGTQNGWVNSSKNYTISDVYSVYGQENYDGSIMYFRFDIGLDDGTGDTIRMNYETLYDQYSGSTSQPSYALRSILNNGSTGGVDDSANNTDNVSSPSNVTNTDNTQGSNTNDQVIPLGSSSDQSGSALGGDNNVGFDANGDNNNEEEEEEEEEQEQDFRDNASQDGGDQAGFGNGMDNFGPGPGN